MLRDPTKAPESYRGIPLNSYMRQRWDTPIGHWWRQGVDAMADQTPFIVEVGQVWADNDYRKSGRTLRVDSIGDDGYARCTILTNYDDVQEKIDAEEPGVKSMIGQRTKIKVRRLYPNARGYRLISSERTCQVLNASG